MNNLLKFDVMVAFANYIESYGFFNLIVYYQWLFKLKTLKNNVIKMLIP